MTTSSHVAKANHPREVLLTFSRSRMHTWLIGLLEY